MIPKTNLLKIFAKFTTVSVIAESYSENPISTALSGMKKYCESWGRKLSAVEARYITNIQSVKRRRPSLSMTFDCVICSSLQTKDAVSLS